MASAYTYIGHDAIGAFVSERLASIGWDRVDDVGKADVALTYCISSSLLEDAYFDEDGLVKRAHAGTVLVDLSPSTPSFAREISAVATVNDLVFVEAPLSVRDPFGPLEFTAHVACEDPSGMKAAVGLFEALSVQINETGAMGSAQLAKASGSVQMAASVMGAIESEALMRSVHEAPAAGKSGEEPDFRGGYPIELMLADVVAAMTAADDVDLILPQLEAAMHLLELIVVIGGADLNPRALSLLYREEAASAAQGLDWSRAEGLYAGHDHDCGHGEGAGDDPGLAHDDDYGFLGGFGGYSAN